MLARLLPLIPFVTVATLAVVAMPGEVHARSQCIQFIDGQGPMYYAPKFKRPRKGKCASWEGVRLNEASNTQSGSYCTSDDGTTVNLQITTSYLDGRVHLDHLTMGVIGGVVSPFFPQTGNNTFTVLAGPSAGFQGTFVARGVPCPSSAAIPKDGSSGASGSGRPE